MGGASSKQTFTQLIHTLMEKDVGSADHEFWDELWKTVLTTEEIFEILLPDDIRKLISERPENVKTIFTQAVAQLYQVVETPYPIYFQQALNCVRVLTRLVPFLLERNDRWIKDLLWSKRFVKATPEAAATGGEKEGQEGKEPPATENKEEQEGKDEFTESEPLAVILVNTLYHLMFLPDFTIEDPSTEFTENDIDTPAFKAALVWSDRTVTTSTAFDNHRVEILRLMLAIFCDSLYQNADTYDTCSSVWLEVATADDAPYGEIVFSSLLNCVLGYDPVGWSVPYGNLMSTDTAKLVMESSIQALLILLDYGYPIQYDPNQSTGGLPYVQLNEIESKGYNVFRRLLGSIEDPDYLNFIYQGFVRLLNNAHQSESTYLPYSIPRINIEQELLILFWKCLEEIPKFMPYILKHCDITEILVPICYFMLEGRKDPSKVGLMYLCTFTLLKLSGERNFGVALNKVYQLRLPVDVPLFSGNHSDLLIIVLHKLIVSGLDKLSALYSCFLTIICNISPYCKTLSAVSAVKLVNLMQLFVSPNFLYAAEGNHVYVGLLLETFNNIVQYQYEGNGNLVYSIIRRKDIFESLSNLTLPAAIKTASDIGQKSNQPKKEANHTNHAGNNPTTAKISKGGKLQKGSDENLEVYAEAKPTELISTQNLERKLGDEGEVIDVKTEEAESRTPNAPEKESSTILPPRPPASEHEVVPSQLPPGRFIPTEKWLQAVKAELPLNTLMRLLKHLVPQIDELSNKTHSLEEKVVLDFLHSTTMVGLLPVPHPIVIRKYQPNKFTCLWFTAFLWGVVFMHNQTLPLYDGKNVKLFIVQSV